MAMRQWLFHNTVHLTTACNSKGINLTLQEPDSEYNNHTNTDSQCNYKHSGILCGGCQPGLSLALGSDQCLPCSNVYISLLLPFAMAGVLLVFVIKVLNLTISQGTLNELIFYANVVNANQYLYYNRSSVNPLTIFIAWFSRNRNMFRQWTHCLQQDVAPVCVSSLHNYGV